MAQIATTIRLDSKLKNEFERLCNDFGMSVNTAINIFVKTVVRRRRIPFSIEADAEPAARGVAAMELLRSQAKKNDTAGMSLEEITNEISNYRAGI